MKLIDDNITLLKEIKRDFIEFIGIKHDQDDDMDHMQSLLKNHELYENEESLIKVGKLKLDALFTELTDIELGIQKVEETIVNNNKHVASLRTMKEQIRNGTYDRKLKLYRLEQTRVISQRIVHNIRMLLKDIVVSYQLRYCMSLYMPSFKTFSVVLVTLSCVCIMLIYDSSYIAVCTEDI